MPSTRTVARRALILLIALTVMVGLLAAPPPVAAALAPRPGGQSSGDSLFPQQGNTGYDVAHYRVRIRFSAATGRISAVTTIRARAKHALSSFSLDLEGLTVTAVTVNGRPARYSRQAAKLVVTPTRPVRRHFSAVISYGGTPVSHTDPDGSTEGWIRHPDGATALNEPVGAMTWFPVNNTLRDKARFTFVVTAANGRAVAANGVLRSRVRRAGDTTWTWQLRQPIAPYLTLVSIGDYRIYRSTYTSITGRKVPVWTFVQPSLGSLSAQRAVLPSVLRFEERHFGPYRFGSAGLVFHELDVGYALETATRPFFPGAVGTTTIVHELAHQWFGNTVTPCDWSDIWLNEGFATYSEWLWRGAHGGPSPAAIFDATYASNPPSAQLWRPAPAGLTDPADLFVEAVYVRGAMTLQVLRERVGSADFARILKRWAQRPRHRCVTTAEFIALAERVSGSQLDQLFRDWLAVPGRPDGYADGSASGKAAAAQPLPAPVRR